MAKQISSHNEFIEKVKNAQYGVVIIFFNKDSDQQRIQKYEEILLNKYASVNCYKIDSDGNVLTDEERRQYVATNLICVTTKCKDSITCTQNPNSKTLDSIIAPLLECK